MNSVEQLTRLIMGGLPNSAEKNSVDEQTRAAIAALFGERYQARSPYALRVVSGDGNIPFGGLVHHDSPNSGVYGGMSLIWFPVGPNDGNSAASLLTLVCGTRGLAPDEHILGRPGHLRHLKALRRYLAQEAGVDCWVKHNPADLSEPFPRTMQKTFHQFDDVIKKYGNCIYFAVQVPNDFEKAKLVFSSLLDLYAFERNWTPLKAASCEVDGLMHSLRSFMFPRVTRDEIDSLLKSRRFVILQGPPGCGKSRMAKKVLQESFQGHGFTVQFHPAVSYESFVAGISPRVDDDTLNFEVKPGWLLQAIRESGDKPFLLVIDEINRADLARVLGEAIYLFEPREIDNGTAREVRLTNKLDDGQNSISIPKNFYILGTMNSADRSIAIMDLAVRRRFAFVDFWPDGGVVAEQKLPLATEAFARLQDIFTQFTNQDAFSLLPGHSYFLAESDEELSSRMKFDLLPLLNEYLLEGRLSSCESELRAYMDWLDAKI